MLPKSIVGLFGMGSAIATWHSPMNSNKRLRSPIGYQSVSDTWSLAMTLRKVELKL